MTILKFILLFIAVWFTIINIVRTARASFVPWQNILFQTIGIVGYLVLQFPALIH